MSPEISDVTENKAPLLEHLTELRRRLIYALLCAAAAIGGCYYFSQEIFIFLTEPLKQSLGENVKLSYFAPHEAFFSYMNLAIYSGLALSFPFVSLQIWAFTAPGLYRHEKRAALPFLLLAPLMFCAGAAFAYYVVMPAALEFFASFQSPLNNNGVSVVQENRVSDYLSFAVTFLLIFGISFELPVALVTAGRFGLISAQGLRQKRKYVVLAMAVFCAAVTPPDILSMGGLFLPLFALFELSVLIIALFEKKRCSSED